jgi:murein L,D-transpeptidase YcbB/YkuD
MSAPQVHSIRIEGSQLGRALAILCGLIGLTMLGLGHAAEMDDLTAPIIRGKIEQLRHLKALKIDEAQVFSTLVLTDFYERRAFHLVWRNPMAIDDLFRAIRDSEADGLEPRDYHLASLERLRRDVETTSPPPPALLADFDILLTDALVRLLYHLMFGKVDPERLDPHWNMARMVSVSEPILIVQRLESVLDTPSLFQTLEREKPQHPFYTGLQMALASYRAIKAAGGWPRLPPGPTLKVGMQDPRVPLLRRRLSITGDLSAAASDTSWFFDSTLQSALKSFQRRHGIAADGSLGPETLAALNVPVEERIQQLRINLERARWVLHNLGNTFIVVNVAAYHAYYLKDGHLLWQGRTMVGKPYRQTPMFKADMTYLVFNPNWTVPPTILAQDYLPALRQDPSYLDRKGLKVVDRAGRAVNPMHIDWSQYSPRHSPYLLRQDPGPKNALGRVKFMFPNDHAVYLHDTPSQALFNRTERAFSSGCIRVENALELARLLLNDEPAWNQQAIDRVLSLGKTRNVMLQEPIPVLLLYWTAWVATDGLVNFRHDLYARDKLVQHGLSNGFRFRKRHTAAVPAYSARPTALEIRDRE